MDGLLHPRLSLSAITAPHRPFEGDLDFWSRAGLRCVGLYVGKLRQFGVERAIDAIKDRGFAVSSVITGPFTLLDPSRWDAERDAFNRCIDIAQAVGGAVYGPPGKGLFDAWDVNAATYAEVVQPCVEYGRARGVKVGFEPTLRPNLSFVHNLVDSLDLAEISGADIIVDIGNAYTERDVCKRIAKVAARTALVQVSDVAIGTMEQPGAGTRTLPGEGELPIASFLHAAAAAGYQGPFEVEFLGSATVDEDAVRASLRTMDAMLTELLGAEA